jgi:copper transport protein
MLQARWRRLIAVPLFSVPVSLPVASTHEALRRSVPADGAKLDVPPTELRLTFRAPVALERMSVELALAGGRRFELGPLRGVPDSAALVVADVREPLDSGRYVVTWRATSADGHPVTGSFRFGVLARLSRPDTSATITTAPDNGAGCDPGAQSRRPCDTAIASSEGESFSVESAPYVAIRWLTFASIVLLIGVVLFDFSVLRPLDRSVEYASVVAHARESLRSLALVAALGTVTSALLRVWAQRAALQANAAQGEEVSLGSVLAMQPWTTGLALQLGAGTGALLALAVVKRRAPSGALLWVALLAAVAPALMGHAVAAPNAVLSVATDITHVLAAAAWVGGVAAIALAGLPAATRAEPSQRAGAALALLGGFSRVALMSAALLVLTGVIAAWINLSSLGDLIGTGYGRMLLVKIGLVVAMALLGALNWRRLGPACATGAVAPVRTSALMEVGVGALVILATAILVATALPSDL